VQRENDFSDPNKNPIVQWRAHQKSWSTFQRLAGTVAAMLIGCGCLKIIVIFFYLYYMFLRVQFFGFLVKRPISVLPVRKLFTGRVDRKPRSPG